VVAEPSEIPGAAAVTPRRRGAVLAPPGEPRRIGYLFVLPALAVYAAFVLWPFGRAVWLSLHQWDGLLPKTWVGLDNYREIVESGPLRSAFAHSLVLIVFYSVIPVTLGLVLAAALSRARIRGQAAFRTILFLPVVMPMVVVAVIWRMIYAPQDGSLNEFLRAVGLDSLTRPWLGDFGLALPAVGIIGTWVMMGLALVLFMAGVQRIPQSLYDAARVGRLDLRARVPGLQPRVPARPDRLGGGDRDRALARDLRHHLPHHPDRGHRPVIGRGEQALNYGILILFSLIALYPVFGIVATALAPPGELVGFGIPSSIHLQNFRNAWDEGHFATYLRSSVIVAVAVVASSTVLSILSGFAFGTMRFRGATPLFYLFLLGLMVPTEALVVPLYFDLRDIDLTDTYWALILPQIALSVSFGTFWMRAFFRATPRSILEAARIDGASSWTTLWRVLVPFGRPAILTMMVLVFMWTWNEFLLALVMVSSESKRTAPLGLAFFQGQHTSDLSLLAAGAVIVALPVVLVYVFLQRHFIRGMLSGAVKG
jgi:raffinose/stachyose/melibiose transport system permease protein